MPILMTFSAQGDDQLLQQAALDGALPYNDQGLATLQYYWFNAWAPEMGPYTPGIVPVYVQQWRTAYAAVPLNHAINQYAQGTMLGSGQRLEALVQLRERLLQILKLHTGNTFGAWIPPGGGLFPPFADASVAADLPNATVTTAMGFLQSLANAQWSGLVQQFPDILTAVPSVPFPGVPVPQNGQGIRPAIMAAAAGAGTQAETSTYAPVVPVSSGGGIGTMPVLLASPPPASPATTGALAVMPDSIPTVGQVVAPVASAQAFTAPPTMAPVDWTKWAAITGIAASVVLVLVFLKVKVK
jgi:hypothetical protein